MSLYDSGREWIQYSAIPRKKTRLAVDVAKRRQTSIEPDPLARLVKVVPVNHRQHEQHLRWVIERKLSRLMRSPKKRPTPHFNYAGPVRRRALKKVPLPVAKEHIYPEVSEFVKAAQQSLQEAINPVASPVKTKRRALFKPVFALAAVAIVFSASVLILGNGETKDGSIAEAKAIQESRAVLGISTGEQPVVMTVTDKDKVTQPFLKDAQNGDKVYLYYQAKKAVVYSGSTGEILTYGEFLPPPARVFVRVASEKTNVQQIIDTIKSDTRVSYTSQDVSPRPNYTEMLLVDLNGRYPEDIKRLAASLKATVVELPSGESVPDADILVLVGAR